MAQGGNYSFQSRQLTIALRAPGQVFVNRQATRHRQIAQQVEPKGFIVYMYRN